MSLPGSAIEQLREEADRNESDLRKRARELAESVKFLNIRNGELLNTIEKQKDQIKTLELSNDTLKRRVYSLETAASESLQAL